VVRISIVHLRLFHHSDHQQDFDGGSVGQAVSQAFVAATGPKDQMTWVIRDPQDFPNGMADVEKAVGESHPWAAVASTSFLFLA
jgi:hypothetical protein